MTDSEKPQKNKQKPQKSEPNVPENDVVKEVGGRQGPDPTRYGDWEIAGKCVDF